MRQEFRESLEEANGLITRMQRMLDTTFPESERSFQELERTLEGQVDEAINEQMENARQQSCDIDAQIRTKVSQLVEKAGPEVIMNSEAIHACAFNLQPEYIELLLEFVPECKKRQVINKLDLNGETPLRTAAMNGMFSSIYPDIRFKTCQKIIDLGGDRNLVDSAGLTALGKFRKADWDRGGASSQANPNYRVQVESALALEELLRPTLGPTAADDAILDAGSESIFDEDDNGLDDESENEENEESDLNEEEGEANSSG